MCRAFFQLQLLASSINCAPLVASMVASNLQSSKLYTLSISQQASLAELIHLTIDPTTEELQPVAAESAPQASSSSISTQWRDMAERACINEIVKTVDTYFSEIASDEVVSSLWSTDDGVSDEVLTSLASSLRVNLETMTSMEICTTPKNGCHDPKQTSCDEYWGGWSVDKQKMIARQAANALVRACRKGKSAKFKVTESQADQLLRLMTPLILEAHSHIVLISFLLLATAGALVCMDTLAHKLLGRRKQSSVESTLIYNECSCAICSGKLLRGQSIGEGGFGQVYLCESEDIKDGKPPPPRSSKEAGETNCIYNKVVKMIGADFERDVTVLQDALDEAKHLLSLKHKNVVRYYDVFVHRDVEGMRSRDLKRRQLESDRHTKKEKSNRWGGWGASEFEGNSSEKIKATSSESGHDAQYDYVCIVMEYCAGGTLLEYVASGVLLPLDVVVNTFLQVISALNHIHSKGIVHFDVKLENVFISKERALAGSTVPSSTRRRRRGKKLTTKEHAPSVDTSQTVTSYTIKVGDFGLAARHQVQPASSSITRSTSVKTLTSSPPPASLPNMASQALSPLSLISVDQSSIATTATVSGGPISPLSNMSNSRLLSLPRLEMNRRTTTKTKPKVYHDVGSSCDYSDSDVDSDEYGVFCEEVDNTSSGSLDGAVDSDSDDNGSIIDESCDEFDCLPSKYPAGQGCVGGTAPYQPPEVFSKNTISSQLGPEVDVWAVGCALYETVTCQSLPLEPPYIGQLAMKPETWNKTWKSLSKTFRENVDIMVACALGSTGASFQKNKTNIAHNKRYTSTPQLPPKPPSVERLPPVSSPLRRKNKQPKASHLSKKKTNDGKSGSAKHDEATVEHFQFSSAIQDKEKSKKHRDIIAAGEGLCLLLEKCLSPDPSHRPQLSTLLATTTPTNSAATTTERPSASSHHHIGTSQVGSHAWLKAFQDMPIRFGHSFGKPKQKVSQRENMRSEPLSRFHS